MMPDRGDAPHITVVGAGLAGCEAACTAASEGAIVKLIEMKPLKMSPAHHNAGFAELVCSNSLKAFRIDSAAGLLKEEMRRLGSVCMDAAAQCTVPAGGALAVDRTLFSDIITAKIKSHPRITVKNAEVTCLSELDGDAVIIATGPLTSDVLAEDISALCGGALSFFDAAAPIVETAGIDMQLAFRASRYGQNDREEEGDYINCPMDKQQYEAFHTALVEAQTAPLHGFDRQNVYEGCMPIEVLAKRGLDAIRFGPMKPVGLRDPRTGHRPWAVLQLRNENASSTMLNMVGFQTNLTFSEQKRVFGMIPALHSAEFLRYGVMHRNTFIDSPRLLGADFKMKSGSNHLYFAGQITGVEGYMESAVSGIIAGKNAVLQLTGGERMILPPDTMSGALAAYISDESVANFQPMGANMGLLPPPDTHIRDKRLRYGALAERALASLEALLRKDLFNENYC